MKRMHPLALIAATLLLQATTSVQAAPQPSQIAPTPIIVAWDRVGISA
ncbi:MAG: hypothetical protein ACK4R8_05390 [Thiobacillus sp.]